MALCSWQHPVKAPNKTRHCVSHIQPFTSCRLLSSKSGTQKERTERGGRAFDENLKKHRSRALVLSIKRSQTPGAWAQFDIERLVLVLEGRITPMNHRPKRTKTNPAQRLTGHALPTATGRTELATRRNGQRSARPGQDRPGPRPSRRSWCADGLQPTHELLQVSYRELPKDGKHERASHDWSFEILHVWVSG